MATSDVVGSIWEGNMTTVFTLPTLNAESFESGEAADGDVLTADGAGRAAWGSVP